MILRYSYDRELAQASYLVGCAATGEALIVDPNRDIDQYVALAETEGLTITGIAETHIHADYLSGARELAARTGATLYLSDEGPEEWKYAFAEEAGARLVTDGDTFWLGNIRFDVLHTPGHTPEHISFLVTDTAGADRPMGVFSGDFVFVGDVGRPDLLERAAGYGGTMVDGAKVLFRSLQRFKELPDFLQIWPGHGAGSACGKALGAVPQTTLGYERLFNWAFGIVDEGRFVEEILGGQPEPPRYFAQMKRLNKVGPTFGSDLPAPRLLPEQDLKSSLDEGMVVVDARPATSYASAHIPGTLNIPLGSGFVTWAGWLVPYDAPFGMIVDPEHLDEAVKALRMIGLDDLAGYWSPTVFAAWRAGGHELASIESVDPETIAGDVERGEVTVVDVRGASEYDQGHIPGSTNVPLGYLEGRLAEIPSDQTVIVNCQTGMRSAIATSLLHRHGRARAVNLEGGYDAWQEQHRHDLARAGKG
jgi:hydroxyacylglutathione hydrolase